MKHFYSNHNMEQVWHHFVEFPPHKNTKTWSFDNSTPTSNKDKSCPYNVNTTSTRKVMRIEKNITWGIISWSNTKFSKFTTKELYGRG